VTSLRSLTLEDVPSLVAINNSGVPAVPLCDEETMQQLLDLSSLALGLMGTEGDELLGFLLAMDSGLDYDSENYRFFERHYENYLYIDRIVLSDNARGLGGGTALYEAVFAWAKEAGRESITCEVNVEPPNPGSLRFHRRMGFGDVDQQATKGGSVVVQLLQAPVA